MYLYGAKKRFFKIGFCEVHLHAETLHLFSQSKVRVFANHITNTVTGDSARLKTGSRYANTPMRYAAIFKGCKNDNI